SRLPREAVAAALYESEPLLARLGSAWTWQLTLALLGPAEASFSVIGLFIARSDDPPARTLLAGRPIPFIRRLTADQGARDAIRGKPPHLDALLNDPRGHLLFDFEANALLVAAAFVDASLALRLADSLCESGKPSAAALTVVARRAVAAGLAEEVAARAPTYLDWTQAAAFAGALTPEAVEAIVTSLAPRVVDDADPDQKHVGAVPLLAALAVTGRFDTLASLARSATIPPLSVVQLLLNLNCRSALDALSRSETFIMWSRATHDAYAGTLGGGPRLLPDSAGEEASSAAVLDALLVSAAAPWAVVPGSFEDELDIPQPAL
ncbi:MAG TPA: hypothetical protein VNN25_18560, partial [Thermoanaerobaculia bacterium]|nr:hypothetical protein [Thermoanaerobaculia bacterium]